MRSGRIFAGVAALALLAQLAPAGMALAKIQQAPSSRVVLDLPEGYAPSTHFSGFVNEPLGVSLVLVEMPASAYDQIVKSLDAEALAAKGVLNSRSARLARTDPHLYVQAEQKSAGEDYAKFMLVFRQGDTTALVTANVQKAAMDQGAIKPADIERVLASASLTVVPAPAKDLFALDYLGPFKPTGSILGTTRVYGLDLLDSSGAAAKGALLPTLIVAPSLDRRPLANPQEFAERLLAGLTGISAPRIAERSHAQLAGMEAVELVATATDKDSAGQIVIYQMLLLPAGGGYYRILGQMPQSEREPLLTELRRVAAFFRPLQ